MNFGYILDRAVAADPTLVKVLGESAAREFIMKNGIRPENMQDFVQLIVKECADLVEDDDNAFDILKQFGVEE
jgi:hypothetical protein